MIQTFNRNEDDIREIKLTEPMAKIRMIRAKETYLLASRGSFKTTQGISLYIADCVYEMPGASGIICGPSFEHLGDNTLNPLFNSLTKYGLIEGVHYVIGTPPPRTWPKPYIRVPAKKFDHIISWHNGANQYLISMAKKGSANGISCQYGVFDEAKFLDPDELKEIVFPAFRGNELYYKDHSLYLSKFFATDKLADISKIKWLLDKKELNNYKLFDVIITLQLELDKLKLEYNDAGINKRYKLKPQIEAIEVRLGLLRKQTTCYMESNINDSVQILGENFLKDKKANSSKYVWDIAYQNLDPSRPEDGFYPDFYKENHVYESDTDYNSERELIIAADYQHSVSPICIVQIGDIPGITNKPSLKYIDEVYTLAPEGLEEAVQIFCDRYRFHRNKVVRYVYDQTATGRRNNADAYYKIVVDTLQRNGWIVMDEYTGRQPGHYQKWVDTKNWLRNDQGTSMPIMINSKCIKTIKSIEGSPAKTNTKGETQKEKKYEDTNQYPHMDQSETTHFSDVFDMINHAVLKLGMIGNIGFSTGGGGGAR